ncbi:hypothetical protein E2C01_078383 [Portunus trituberculatus]|uniref:Uncharacterized protein n=1 Tax=Portunus trituberculatus TaxID=210409 RepID=A0A5B7ISL7_PORTR|nr:hypothetical protein [Portunus trituberculatus]
MEAKSLKSRPQIHRRLALLSPCGRGGAARGVGGVAGACALDRQATDPPQEPGRENTTKSLFAIMTAIVVTLAPKCSY